MSLSYKLLKRESSTGYYKISLIVKYILFHIYENGQKYFTFTYTKDNVFILIHLMVMSKETKKTLKFTNN